MKTQKGFTLIEVLIVIAIIGILASVVIVGLGPIQGRGRDARRISDLRSIQNALELYYNKNSAYPASATFATWSALQTELTKANGIGVSNIPQDPGYRSTDTTPKTYSYYSDGTTYTLRAKLDDANNPIFSEDVDGAFGSTAAGCDDPYYCIKL